MKNMAVAKKIMLGFGVAILLIAIMLGLTVYTSLTRNNELTTVDVMSDLQYEANVLLDEVNSARIELQAVFTTLGADAEYELAMQYIRTAQARMDTLDGYAATLKGSGAAISDTLETDFARMRALLNDVVVELELVYQYDVEAREHITELLEAGTAMAESTTEMFDLAYGVSLDRTTSDPESLSTYLPSLLLPCHQISELVDGIRIMNRDLILNYDTSVVPSMTADLDMVRQNAQQIKTVATTDAGQVASQAVLDAEAIYRTDILLVEQNLNDSAVNVATAQATFNELSTLVNNGVDGISAETSAMLENTINTSVSTMIVLIIVGVLSVVFSLASAFVISRMITGPLGIMKQYLVRVGTTGDMDFSDEEKNEVRREAQYKDEVGQSLAAFVGMMDRLIYVGEKLTEVANGDLTAEVKKLSDKDTMGNALLNMSDRLNDMFAEINSVAEQVGTASSEIATGAQSLAQGSTEQASTVEEISASINEVTEQANVSVDTATKAASESQDIRNIAQEGNEKMGHLSSAVQEMSDASQSIGNVIKVIDDIAFQTNILALNAAVEAARAGEHGKGFAVVADEVRNLAGKSAEAAKETAGLISANIEKSQLGLTISEETAETLQKIVVGVENTTEQLNTIAQQSEGSKAATEQVNLAVDQVAQVVQQNSATSEQSAAASQQMSSQAQVLRQLIARFKLKGVNRDGDGVPLIAESSEVVVSSGEEGGLLF